VAPTNLKEPRAALANLDAAGSIFHHSPSATPQQVRDALFSARTKSIVTSSKTANNHLLFTSY
jgi:hypothetical protein